MIETTMSNSVDTREKQNDIHNILQSMVSNFKLVLELSQHILSFRYGNYHERLLF